jgi:acyl-coenzyme A synthetase/AMP-(fatty) acid ligase
MVKANLAKHEYPRQIEFIDEFPTTESGKIRRTALREDEHSS